MKGKRLWFVKSRSCHLRTDGPYTSAFKAARLAESLWPEDGYKRVWITSKPLPPPVKRERLAKPPPAIETLERLKRWPRLLKAITLPCYIYSRRRKAFLHEDGLQWLPEAKRPGPPNNPALPRAAGDWEPPEALRRARKLNPIDQLELHELF